MKLKNFAFFGVMASILTISGAYAADGTIIASKGYVDTNFQANNRYQIGNNSWSQVASEDKSSDAKYPSMKTLTAAVGNGVSSVLTQNITDGDTTHAPSGDAVHDAINTLSNTVNNIDMDSKVDKQQTEKGAIMVTNASTGKVETAKVGKHLAIKDGELQTTYKDGTNIEIKDDGSINTTGLKAVATSGSYNDLSDKPTIPTVNNATLTIKKNNASVGTFTANAGTDAAINIEVPTKVSDLTNDSGFITNADDKVSIVQTDEAAKNGFLMGDDEGKLNTFVGLGENMEIKDGKLVTKVVDTDTNTEYTGSNGITLTGTNFTNSGVRAISESTSNGKIKVNTNGTEADVAIHGLGSAAYANTTDFAPAGDYQAAGDYVLEQQEAKGAVMVTNGSTGKVETATVGKHLVIKDGELQTAYKSGTNIEIKEDGSINTTGLKTVATSGSYNDLSDKPTINNATLTIKRNNESVGTFTANSGTDASVNITVPTGALASKDTIKDADVASDAAIQYAKMSGDLKEITTNGAAECNAENPCVLSYIGNNKYRWTNMDIAGLTVTE